MLVESERVRVGTICFVVRKRCRSGSAAMAVICPTFGEARRAADALIAQDKPNDCDAQPTTISAAIVNAIDLLANEITSIRDEVAIVSD